MNVVQEFFILRFFKVSVKFIRSKILKLFKQNTFLFSSKPVVNKVLQFSRKYQLVVNEIVFDVTKSFVHYFICPNLHKNNCTQHIRIYATSGLYPPIVSSKNTFSA